MRSPHWSVCNALFCFALSNYISGPEVYFGSHFYSFSGETVYLGIPFILITTHAASDPSCVGRRSKSETRLAVINRTICVALHPSTIYNHAPESFKRVIYSIVIRYGPTVASLSFVTCPLWDRLILKYTFGRGL